MRQEERARKAAEEKRLKELSRNTENVVPLAEDPDFSTFTSEVERLHRIQTEPSSSDSDSDSDSSTPRWAMDLLGAS